MYQLPHFVEKWQDVPRKRAGTRIPISSSPSHALHESRLPLRIKPTRRSRHRTQGGLAHASQGSGAKALVSLVGDESTSGSNYTGVYALMGIPLISPTWQEFQYLQNSSKILFYTSLDGEPGPWSKAVLLPLNCFSLVSASPPFPNRQLLELRKGGWMKPIFCNQETGDTERLLCSGAPLGPTWFQHFSFLKIVKSSYLQHCGWI